MSEDDELIKEIFSDLIGELAARMPSKLERRDRMRAQMAATIYSGWIVNRRVDPSERGETVAHVVKLTDELLAGLGL